MRTQCKQCEFALQLFHQAAMHAAMLRMRCRPLRGSPQSRILGV